MPQLEYRPLGREHLSEIHSIEATVYEDPWTLNLLEQSLAAPMTHTLGAFDEHQICKAYAIYQVIFTEAHLLNLAVSKELQGQGVGSALLDRVMKDAKLKGAESIFLEVRPSNVGAIHLYEKRRFKSLMIRERYYSNGEAAMIMVADLYEAC